MWAGISCHQNTGVPLGDGCMSPMGDGHVIDGTRTRADSAYHNFGVSRATSILSPQCRGPPTSDETSALQGTCNSHALIRGQWHLQLGGGKSCDIYSPQILPVVVVHNISTEMKACCICTGATQGQSLVPCDLEPRILPGMTTECHNGNAQPLPESPKARVDGIQALVEVFWRR